jgi:hypothetical protein
MTDRDEVIARLIAAADEPPPGLVAAVAKARATLVWTIQKERGYPYRNELRARLEKLAAAVETVRNGMRDLDMSTLLLGGDAFFLNQNETYHGLGDLGEKVKRTLSDLPVRVGQVLRTARGSIAAAKLRADGQRPLEADSLHCAAGHESGSARSLRCLVEGGRRIDQT